MLKDLLSTFQWSISVGLKFLHVVPAYTLIVVLTTLISQVSLLLAFFLPLKVIILLGSAGIPGYFPSSWQSFDRDNLITSLALSAAGFYLLYIFSEKLINWCSKRGADHLLMKSKKITMFKNQDEIAVRTYQRYSRSLASSVFVCLALVTTGIIYPALLIVILGYVFSIFIVFSLGYVLIQSFRNWINQNLYGFGSIVSALGFLLAFLFMVLDFLVLPAPAVIQAIIGLLLVRQLMSRLVTSITDLNALYSQRLLINALFFHGHPLLSELPKQEHAFWSLIESSQRNEWISNVLKIIIGSNPGQIESNWHQTGISDVLAFEITSKDHEGELLGQYLIKLFNKNKRSLALHEASLLKDSQLENLPALKLLGEDTVEGFHCNIFQWSGESKISPKKIRPKRLEFLRQLIIVEPDKKIVEKYKRSHEMLPQRINNKMLDRLALAAGNSHACEQVKILKSKIDDLQSKLNALPLQLVNPDIKPDTLLNTPDKKLTLTHWGRWRIEPIGAGWPAQEKGLAMLEEALISSIEYRPSLINIKKPDVQIVAITFALEQLYNRQQYISALELLPSLLSYIDSKDINVQDNE